MAFFYSIRSYSDNLKTLVIAIEIANQCIVNRVFVYENERTISRWEQESLSWFRWHAKQINKNEGRYYGEWI